MNKPKLVTKKAVHKADGYENDPDVQFNANLLNLTNNNEEELVIDGVDSKEQCKLIKNEYGIENKPPLNNNHHGKEEKGVLLLKSI